MFSNLFAKFEYLVRIYVSIYIHLYKSKLIWVDKVHVHEQKTETDIIIAIKYNKVKNLRFTPVLAL